MRVMPSKSDQTDDHGNAPGEWNNPDRAAGLQGALRISPWGFMQYQQNHFAGTRAQSGLLAAVLGSVMEKTIALENDPVFRRAVRLIDNVEYHTSAQAVSAAVCRRAALARAQLARLRRMGRLDRLDLRIISLRQRSPAPTWREIGAELHLSKQAVHRRAEHVKTSMLTAMRRENG